MSKVLQHKCHRISSASNIIFTKTSTFDKERDLRKCNSAKFTTKTSEARHENLIVEDLEGCGKTTPFTRKTSRYNRSQQTAELVQEARYLYNHILEDVLAGRDLNVYQGADFQDFFRETEPKRVSEVCLVNDHFMLVKMPETCWRRTSQIDSIAEEEVDNEDGLKLVEIREEEPIVHAESRNNKVRNYFHCNRSSRVSPIHDQELQQMEYGAAGDATNKLCNKVKSTLPIGSSWIRKSTEVEVHKTITKISGSKIGTLNNDNERHQGTEVFRTITKISGKPKPKKNSDIKVVEVNGKSGKQHQKVTTLTLHKSKVNIDQALGDDLSGGLKARTLLEDYDMNPRYSLIFNSSLHDSVSFEHNGTLITPQRRKLFSGKNGETEKRKQSKKLPRFNAFRWLLKPFRLRNQRAPKAKIHAVINKTYFVRWKKPPDDYINGFGVKPTVVTEMPILRRCRSATF